MPKVSYNQQSNWTSYSMTIGATTTPPTKGTVVADIAQFRRVGDSMEIMYTYEQSAIGTAGSGTYLFPIPAGFTIDTSKVGPASGTADIGTVGSATVFSTAHGVVQVWDSTNLVIKAGTDAVAPAFAGAGGSIGDIGANATMAYGFRAVVPIVEFA